MNFLAADTSALRDCSTYDRVCSLDRFYERNNSFPQSGIDIRRAFFTTGDRAIEKTIGDDNTLIKIDRHD